MTDKRLKILLFTPTVGRGGVTTVVETMTREMANLGVNMHILGQTYNENGREIQYDQRLPFTQVRPVDKLPSHPDQFSFLVRNAHRFAEHLAEVQDDYDLIWSATPWWCMGASESWNIHKPVVANIPDFAFDHIGMGAFLTAFFRSAAPRIAQRADLTIFSSDFQREWGEANYGFTRTERIRYSMEFSQEPSPVTAPPSLPDDYILAFHCMGHKDPLTIFQGFALARQMNPQVPPLVVGGIDTGALLLRSALDKQTARLLFEIRHVLNLRPGRDFFVLGEVDRGAIPDLYRRARMTIVASRSEGDLSGSVHEAIRYKTPLLFCDLPVFMEQLISERHGLSFRIGDPVDLSWKISYALQNREMLARMTEFALEDFSKRSAKHVALDHLQAFVRVVEKNQR